MNKTFTIIGAGRVGKAIGKLWTLNRTLSLQDVLARSLPSAEQARSFIGTGQAVSDYVGLRPADIYLIATPDDQIQASCVKLVQTKLLTADSIVFHCSGALPSSILQAARDQHAAVASIHPIRSFASPDEVVKNFSGTWCGMEGDQRALDVLAPAFTSVGAQLVPIKAEAKIHYHAAAVFACNYLVTLLDIAKQSYVQAGIAPETALKMMEPLMRETLNNVFQLGPEAALTGPIARGDMATATKQWQAVATANPKHGELYRQLMNLTIDLAARRQSLKC